MVGAIYCTCCLTCYSPSLMCCISIPQALVFCNATKCRSYHASNVHEYIVMHRLALTRLNGHLKDLPCSLMIIIIIKFAYDGLVIWKACQASPT
jgi:hypothetical protein